MLMACQTDWVERGVGKEPIWYLFRRKHGEAGADHWIGNSKELTLKARSSMPRLLATVLLLALLSAVATAQGWVDRTGLNQPPARFGHGMAYDPIRGYTIMAGGQNRNQQALTDTWTWDGTAWTQQAASFPNGRNCKLCFDPLSNQVIAATFDRIPQISAVYLDLHAWDGTAWIATGRLLLNNNSIEYPMIAFDFSRNEMVAYATGSSTGYQEIFTWDGAAWTTRTCPSIPSWPFGPSLYYGGEPSMSWDPTSQAIVLTAGFDTFPPSQNPNPYGTRYWQWTGFNWQQRFPTTRPENFGSTTTDSVAGCIIMIDGITQGPSAQLPGHTWTIRNGIFQRILSPAEPMLRRMTAMAFDPIRNVTILFGGSPDSQFVSNPFPFSDTWELSLGAPASYTPYGSGCAGSRGIPQLTAQGTSVPRIGSQFTAQASNLPWTGPVFLFFGLSDASYAGTPLPANLGFLGAPNCNLLASGEDVIYLPNVLGSAVWSFQVPPLPGVRFYNQILPQDPFANPLGLTTSNAARGVIGL